MAKYNVGDKVYHKSFGYGIVQSEEGKWVSISFGGKPKKIYFMEHLFIPLDQVDKYEKSNLAKLNRVSQSPKEIEKAKRMAALFRGNLSEQDV